MRVSFDELFNVSGSQVSPKGRIKIGGVTMSPGVSFGGGVSFSGVDLSQYIGHDLEVEQLPDGTVEIKGTY